MLILQNMVTIKTRNVSPMPPPGEPMLQYILAYTVDERNDRRMTIKRLLTQMDLPQFGICKAVLDHMVPE